MSALTVDSTPRDVYTVCHTYQLLRSHKHLEPVRKLLRCIITFNHCHRLYNTVAAFERHRQLTLDGQIHVRRRGLARPASPVHDDDAPSALSASSAASVDPNRFIYSEQLTSSMHACSLQIDERIYTQKRWLCDSSMNLALLSLNKRQGLSGTTLFIPSLFLQSHLDVFPDTTVSGRRPVDCSRLVKCVNVNNNHWVVAVWQKQQPSVVYALDSMFNPATAWSCSAQHHSVTPFIMLCQALAGGTRIVMNDLAVAQQKDNSSCGLFVIEYCRVLGEADADISTGATRERLQQVSTEGTRQWLCTLSRTLDIPQRDPLFQRSARAKRNRTTWDAEQARTAPEVE